MDAVGSNAVNVTRSASTEGGPAWSPDGARIAFASDRTGAPELYLMNPDGSNVVRVTTQVGFAWSRLTWSPDSSRVAFSCEVDPGNRDMCVIGVNGSDLVRLTAGPGIDEWAAWSPDGSTIAFSTTRYGADQHFEAVARFSQLPCGTPSWRRRLFECLPQRVAVVRQRRLQRCHWRISDPLERGHHTPIGAVTFCDRRPLTYRCRPTCTSRANDRSQLRYPFAEDGRCLVVPVASHFNSIAAHERANREGTHDECPSPGRPSLATSVRRARSARVAAFGGSRRNHRRRRWRRKAPRSFQPLPSPARATTTACPLGGSADRRRRDLLHRLHGRTEPSPRPAG